MENKIRKLYIEASSRCNLSCKMCFRHSWVGEKMGDLDPALFTDLLEDPAFSQIETVFFGGMGEPLIHPQIIDMIAQASVRKKKTEIITNGTLLDRRTSEALIRAGLDRLWISIDEIYDNYVKIQRGGSFEKVLRHLEDFNELRRGTDVRLGMTAVLMRDNISSMASLKDFAQQCRTDDMNFSHMIPNRAEEETQTLWSICDDAVRKSETDRIAGTTDLYHLLKFGFRVSSRHVSDPEGKIPMFKFSDLFKRTLFPNEEHLNESELFSWKGVPAMRRANYCRFIEEGHCFVRWDGDIAPCMGLLHSAVTYLNEQKRTIWRHSFGNLRQQSLSEIWNSEEYRAFRERVHSFNYSPCLSCGGCDLRTENRSDCTGNETPVCGACLWAQGFISCP